MASLRDFMGLTKFYRCFVLNYDSIDTFLTDPLEVNSFKYANAYTVAFETPKTMEILPTLT
jgi:hypothetical protein